MQEGFSFASSLRKGREEQTSFCRTACNMDRCYTSSPTWLSKHTTSLAGRAPAHLALGFTGAEVARAVKLRNDAVMQQNTLHGTCPDSAKRRARDTQPKLGRHAKPLQRGSRSPLLLRWGGLSPRLPCIGARLTNKPHLQCYPS